MKKTLALLLAVITLLSMAACGGSAETAEIAPATTEAPTTVPTEAPTEEPTESPAEAPTEPRVAPTDFETVDPATLLPKPIPVEKQLLGEGTQTVTLGSLEEYEDLLWSLGFEEVRLAGTHEAWTNTEAYCEPVSLTYNEKAFRFDFTYYIQESDGDLIREDGWYMYGTKSSAAANISPLSGAEYFMDDESVKYNDLDYTKLGLDLDENATNEEEIAAIEEMIMNSTNILQTIALLEACSTEEDSAIVTSNYEEKVSSFGLRTNNSAIFYLKTVYYPATGNDYNFMRDAQYKDTNNNYVFGQNSQVHDNGYSVGDRVRKMCFYYLFPTENAAE